MDLKITAFDLTNFFTVYAFVDVPFWKFWDSGRRAVLQLSHDIDIPDHIHKQIKKWHDEQVESN